jgi:SpoVK/Ycf46/Vps4 family AAA+-type ATPase
MEPMSQQNEKPSFLNGPLVYPHSIEPILSDDVKKQLLTLVQEHQQLEKLHNAGLQPASSLIFVGKPGVGKTFSAHWLADKLGLPLFTIDLATIISSYLGQTGNNLKTALSYAKERPMVLLLDEIDTLAKKRNDDTDVGELKRIVVVLLQEIENWPPKSILIAATNHPELVDSALWRRFDHVFQFDPPTREQVEQAVRIFLAGDYEKFKDLAGVIALLLEGSSYSEIERQMLRFRRTLAIGSNTPVNIVSEAIQSDKDRKHRLEYARQLMKSSDLSQYKINELTGVSRDTLRKYKSQRS